MKKYFALIVSLLLLAGCATTPNPIKADLRSSLFVKDVKVTWSYADEKNRKDPEYVAGKDDLINRLEKTVGDSFKNSPSGKDGVTFEINVLNYNRVSAAMGNLIGGSNMVSADVTVKSIADGGTLGVYKGVSGAYTSNSGLIGAIAQAVSKPDIVGIMAGTFAADLRKKFDAESI